MQPPSLKEPPPAKTPTTIRSGTFDSKSHKMRMHFQRMKFQRIHFNFQSQSVRVPHPLHARLQLCGVGEPQEHPPQDSPQSLTASKEPGVETTLYSLGMSSIIYKVRYLSRSKEKIPVVFGTHLRIFLKD